MAGLSTEEPAAGDTGKRPTDTPGERSGEEAGAAEAPQREAKRPCLDLQEQGGQFPFAEAAAATAAASGLGVRQNTTRVEVCWEVSDDAGDAEAEQSLTLWWGCTVAEAVGRHPAYGPMWLLKYDEKEVEGKVFEAEERRVIFCAPELLIDVAASEEGGGGGGKGLMLWRAEGSTHEPLPLLPVGQPIKAKYKGEDTWFAGVVHDLNTDGTYHVKYEDGDQETSVPRDLIEPVEVADDGEEDDEGIDEEAIVAHDIDSFFELFTTIMTSGEMFVNLAPEKQRFAAERIANMRPFFRVELEKLIQDKGRGYTVTGTDINHIIPKVMQAAKNAADAFHA